MLFFNKSLFTLSFVACTAAINCNATENDIKDTKLELSAKQIPDVSKILPPIGQYVEKMKNVTERYKDVFNKMSETEVQKRVENAKQKALNFYADIFGVELSEVTEYNTNFTTEQTLIWIAKEVINNGQYEFATNEDELLLHSDMDALHAEERDDLIECFNSDSKKAFPSLDKVSELCKIRCMYNSPNFAAIIVHETGHVLDYAYRVLLKIRNKTMGPENSLLCEEAISVFFETIYQLKNDRDFILERLTDLYQICFEQAYVECIKKRSIQDKLHAPDTYQKVSKLSNWVCYNPMNGFSTENFTQFKTETLKEYPELSFVFDLWDKQTEKIGLTPGIIHRLTIPLLPTTGIHHVLEIYKQGAKKLPTDITAGKLSQYVKYVPHAYRTLKIYDHLNSSKSVFVELDNIVKNVPDIMSAKELKDFLKLIGL